MCRNCLCQTIKYHFVIVKKKMEAASAPATTRAATLEVLVEATAATPIAALEVPMEAVQTAAQASTQAATRSKETTRKKL